MNRIQKSRQEHAGLLPSYAKWDGVTVKWDQESPSDIGKALSKYEHNRVEFCDDKLFEKLGIHAFLWEHLQVRSGVCVCVCVREQLRARWIAAKC